MSHPPTSEQSAILDFIRESPENLMIRALAGTGKSSTLEMIDKIAKPVPHLYLVFGKANQLEAEKKFASSTIVRTFNGIGHRVWGDFCTKSVKLNKSKQNDIFREIVAEVSSAEAREYWLVYDQVMVGVNLARAIGYIPSTHAKSEKSIVEASRLYSLLDERPGEITKELIDSILLESIRQSYNGIIDFPDQCYMPALFGGFYPRFPLVLVDEYQDLSPVQHAMLDKLCKHSRQIGVGDDAQSIYGFRGAKAGGMEQAIEKFQMATMSLSVSFRCPSKIVENVHWRVPDFKAFREGGIVSTKHNDEILDNTTVLCRNNAPLLTKAMHLIQDGRAVNVSGVDIGDRLLRLMKKLGDESMTKAQTLSRIDEWQAQKLANGSKSAKDMAECMRVFVRKSPSLGAAIAYAKHMFEQSGTIQFMTGHKSKGLEFDHVYHLEPGLCSDHGQDPNIKYVIDTRSRNTLTYI